MFIVKQLKVESVQTKYRTISIPRIIWPVLMKTNELIISIFRIVSSNSRLQLCIIITLTIWCDVCSHSARCVRGSTTKTHFVDYLWRVQWLEADISGPPQCRLGPRSFCWCLGGNWSIVSGVYVGEEGAPTINPPPPISTQRFIRSSWVISCFPNTGQQYGGSTESLANIFSPTHPSTVSLVKTTHTFSEQLFSYFAGNKK